MRLLACCAAVLLASSTSVQPPSSEELIKQLKSPEADVRRVAAEALGRDKAVAAIPALAELLKDKEMTVRSSAAIALVRIGPKSAAALGDALKFPEENSRLTALQALRILGPAAKEAVPALAGALKDKSTNVRILAAYTLGQMKADAKAALPALFEATKDTANVGEMIRPDLPSSVAEAAVGAALRIDDKCAADLAKAAVPALIEALQSKDGAVLLATGSALRTLGIQAKAALPALEQAHERAKGIAQQALAEAIVAVGGRSSEVLAALIQDPKTPLEKRLGALAELGFRKSADDKAMTALMSSLKDINVQIRAAAVDAVSWIGPPGKAAIPLLVDLLGDEKMDEAAALAKRPSNRVVAAALTRMGTAAVRPVADLLKDDQKTPFARWQAAATLSGLGRHAKPALPVLEAMLKDPFPPIAIESACAFARAGGDISKALPILEQGLKHESPFLIWHTAAAVERIGPRAQETVPLLTRLLGHKEAEIRVKAAQALSAMGPAAAPAVPAMAKLLLQPDPQERFAIAVTLERLGPEARAALPALVQCLKDLESVSPHPVLVAIGNIGPDAKSAVPALVELLKQKDTTLQREVIETLGRIGPEARPAVPKLMELLYSEDDRCRQGAARTLSGIGSPAKDAVPALKKLLDDPQPANRVWAGYALARILGDYKSGTALLIDLWKADEGFAGSSRYEIARALDLLGAEARPALDLLLEALLNDKTAPSTRYHVARALGHLRDKADAIVPKVMGLIDHKAEGPARVRSCVDAAQCLALLGPQAKSAVPRLRQLAEDEDNEVAEAAVHALASIEAKTAK
jgi:HEAT repeat protein